jgi:hypothetical protein
MQFTAPADWGMIVFYSENIGGGGFINIRGNYVVG